MREFYFKIISYLSCILILCFWAFYNGYPLVFFDTGTYIVSGFSNEVPLDRPITYGYFVRHTSMHESLWFTIWAQALVLTYSIHCFLKYQFTPRIAHTLLLVFVFIISFFSGASVNASQLIPDVFTPITIICICILLFTPQLKRADWILVSLSLLLSICTHNSHFIITLLIAGCALLYNVILNYKKKELAYPYKNLILVFSIAILANITNSSLSYYNGGGFNGPKGGHVFYFARLIDFGVMDDYLNETCPTTNYKICTYKDSIPWDFIWDYNKSPLYKTGGWEGNKGEYTTIIKDLLSQPKYVKKVMVKSFESGIKQFFTFDVGDTPIQDSNSPAFYPINRFFNDSVKEYFASLQCNGHLNWDLLNAIQRYTIMIAFVLNILLLASSKLERKWKHLILFILVALFINALVCGALSVVVARYQSRVIWLILLPLLLISGKSNIFKNLRARMRLLF